MRKPSIENCLATKFPKIAAEWHPTKNGDLTPFDVCAGSGKKFWFQCEKGHEWEITPSHRTRINGHNCPYCANKKVCEENCLATLFPKIAAEWHPTKNGKVTPKDVVAKSDKKFWFKCIKGHEWLSSPNIRTMRNTMGCPCCSHHLICEENCLATLFPKIAAEWHPTKNGKVTPKDVLAKSAKCYWFRCHKGHEWKSSLGNRCHNGRNCPRCNESKGEKKLVEIAEKLYQENVIENYVRQYKDKRIRYIRVLPFDIALFARNEVYVVEFHGRQHYEPVNWSGKMTPEKMMDELCRVKAYDRIKRNLCRRYGVKYLAIRHDQMKDMHDIIMTFLSGNGL